MSANGGRGLGDAASTEVTTNFSRGAACASAGVLLGPRVARGLGEGHEDVDVHAGERVPGQNLDCHAVRSGLKRGVFVNWEDVLAQTTGHKGKMQHEAANKCLAQYRAPEILEPPAEGVIGAGMDVWSLGCALYSRALGWSPFEPAAEGLKRLEILLRLLLLLLLPPPLLRLPLLLLLLLMLLLLLLLLRMLLLLLLLLLMMLLPLLQPQHL